METKQAGPGPNRKQRRGLRSIMKARPLDHVEKIAATRTAVEESIKDNLAERVVDNFIAELLKLPFRKRLRFAWGILRGER